MRLFARITAVHPLAFLLAYLAAIPLFGAVYRYAVPSGFYAPYARFEPSGAADNAGLAASLQAALGRALAGRAGDGLTIDGWRYDPASLHVFHLESNDGEQLSFMVGVAARGLGPRQGAGELGESFRVVVPDQPILRRPGEDGVVYRFPALVLESDSSPVRDNRARLFAAVFGEPDRLVAAPLLAFDADQAARFDSVLRGYRGDALAVSGQLGRMCYLSAVVITTLGLGEIVPITPPARALVAAEAVLGIVFAGLFLNALAYRASISQGRDG
jgi:Ion channel